MSDDVVVVEELPEDVPGSWMPIVGPETTSFLNEVVPEASRESIRQSAVKILARGVSPTQQSGRQTGLVIGYIQSGKTMSFESVTALARDNLFQMVIVVAGTSKNLLDQSTRRLVRDFRLDDPRRSRNWIRFVNPTRQDAAAVRGALADWSDPDVPEALRRTILVTVLKQHQRLRSLRLLVEALSLEGVPTLIIDDEADQASLNAAVNQGQESVTYRRLVELRDSLPLHAYLQYTATPQAPLLISIIDSLSPNFVSLIEPGADYVGGRDFFGDNRIVRPIPLQDMGTDDQPLLEPPGSLLEALRIFILGVCAGIVSVDEPPNRSMLVHPSHRTASHREYCRWVAAAMEEWKRTLELPEYDDDRQDLVRDFRHAYEDLVETVPDLAPFEDLARNLRYAIRNTQVCEVNARQGSTPPVDWNNSYSFILVGGQALDRGFTIEGLTVTYMPRHLGVGNADTVQQRARFFGYKRAYFGYCRVYLEPTTLVAYRSLLEHEEDVRNQLGELDAAGRPLDEWKRAFVLAPQLRPCRQQVLEFDYIRGNFSNEWVTPNIVQAPGEIVQHNRDLITAFLQRLLLQEVDGHPNRTLGQRHQICGGVPLGDVVESLLVSLRLPDSTDSQVNTGLLLQLSRGLEENPDATCSVYLMSPLRQREREVDGYGRISELFQGAYPVHPLAERGSVYPGDRGLHSDEVTLQVHVLNLTDRRGVVVAEQVPVVAVWVPADFALSWVGQTQPAQT